MAQRNIHGEWTMSFENRFLRSKVMGATNQEASIAWFEEMKDRLFHSAEGDSTPWVILVDSRTWELGPDDIWDTNNEIFAWSIRHNCVLFSVVYSNAIQKFASVKGLETDCTMQISFDYDEAYQTCLDKLAQAQKQQEK